MRIATWNVNSLKARTDAVERWLARAQPDVLLMQETKLADSEAPELPFRMLGYELVHHGEGRWNGVAIASLHPLGQVVTNFGEPLEPARSEEAGDDEPLAEARMVAVRSVSTVTFTDAGRVWVSCGRSAVMRSTTSITLAPGCRWMLTMTAG